jgi:hypothetical protein
MHIIVSTLLIIGLSSFLIAGLFNLFFYQKHSITITKPENILPPGVATISPTIKHSVLFKVPKSIRTDESIEVTVEYFQGVTYFPLEGINTFLYEKLDLLPQALPNNLRGQFMSTSFKKVKPFLGKEFSIRLTSSKMSIVPEGWFSYNKGTSTPCKWRWSVSCNELGKYALVVELNEAFREKIPDPRLGSPIIFEVSVRSPTGWSLNTVSTIKTLLTRVGIIAGVLGSIVSFLINIPGVQNRVTEILNPWLPWLFK